MLRGILLTGMALFAIFCPLAADEPRDRPWVVYEGGSGPGKGKHIVFVTGDEEYRSEEGMTQLARILAKRHGFRCTVLYAINKETGEIDPTTRDNIPGLENLKSADLMVIFVRWRDLPDEQTKHIIDYAESGRPIIGLRTATHPFKFDTSKTYAKYGWDYKGSDYPGGFGRQVLGETWVAHHGAHGKESARGIIDPAARDHPIVRGIKDGDIWSEADVYTVRLPLTGDARPLVLGQVLEGMSPDDKPVSGPKNDPVMPVAWTRSYTGSQGRTARVFTTTLGTSRDLLHEGFRRLMVNATFWALAMEDRITPELNVDLVGEYNPTSFMARGHKKGIKPADLQ